MNHLLKLFVFIAALSLSQWVQAQGLSVVIAESSNGTFVFKDNEKELIKAFEWTFKDGTKVTDLKIEQLGIQYYLMANCSYQGRKRIAAVSIEMQGVEFVVNEESALKMCSAVACENCKFFMENNRIVACKCEETGTISNHCHYKAFAGSSFFANLQRAIKMNQDK